ncbi:hypothetical protein ACFQ88_08455 [Paenibacillus sp. NPDC056579]|uniref:hypothetical protein n=1 Tax=Paenibacillus sp. NPDC056579 TaxID=3345871 RepID=UPI00367DAD66
MEADQHRIGKRKYLFNVDILIEDETNGRALEKLLHLLNVDEVKDYQIKEGVELGTYIEAVLRETISKPRPTEAATKPGGQPKEAAVPPDGGGVTQPENPTTGPDPHQAIWDQLQQYKQSNSLVRLTVVKGKGVKLNIPCRILNFDPSNGNVSVYHVDEKQVYLFKINEIDDFAVSR